MAEELTRALERRAERGNPRGATAVLAEASVQIATDSERLPSWRRGPAIAFATAGVMLLVVGGILLGSRLLGSDAVAPAETSAPAPRAIDFEQLVWSRIPHDAAVFEDARIDSVTVLAGGLIAVGEDASGAAVWTSPDGFTWTAVPIEVVPTVRSWRIAEVSPGGPGLVATVEDDQVWTSPDGVKWTSSEQTFDGQHEAIAAMTQSRQGLVVVGDGMAYASVNGVEWTPGRCPECSEGSEFGYLADVTAGGPGLVAVGNDTDEGTGLASVWTSPDGLTWSRVQLSEVAEMESVTLGGPGLVAVGHSSQGAEVLTSSDGLTWTAVPHDSEVFGGSLMRKVVAFGDGLVALGEWEWGDGQAWTSLDGVAWNRVAGVEEVFAGASINDAVVLEGRLIAVGSTYTPGEDEDAAVWMATAPGSFEPPTASASGPGPSMLVTGEAVNPWLRTEVAALGSVAVGDLTALRDGGFAVVASEGGNVLWSRDGVSWQEADPNGQTVGSGSQAADDVRIISALPGRVVVLGGISTGDPVVWVGDLRTEEWKPFPLDMDGVPDMSGEQEVAIASSDHDILVAARGFTDDLRYVAWRIDPDTGQVEGSILPPDLWETVSESAMGGPGLEAEWFGDRWVVAVGETTAVSADGVTWVTGRDQERLAADAHWVTSLTAGAGGLIATTCGGWGPHLVWYSDDGLDWVELPSLPGPHSGYAYSDDLGFVIAEEGRLLSSNDGQAWQWTLGPSRRDDGGDLAASGSSLLILADSPVLLTLDVAD